MNPLIIVLILGLLAAGSVGVEVISNDAFTRFDELFKKYGAKYNVPWQWLKAICMNESDLGQNSRVARGLEDPSDVEGSKSYDGLSWGIMQLTLNTARMYNSVINEIALNDPEISVSIAAQYMAYLMRLKGDDLESIVRSYNGGPGWRNSSAKSLEMTAEYWARFNRNYARVLNVQPDS